MAKISNYENWLEELGPEGPEDVYELYSSVGNFEKSGKFYTTKNVTNDGYEYLIKAEGVEDVLFLESDEAKFAFLNYLKTQYTDAGESDINAWYDLKKELGKTD